MEIIRKQIVLNQGVLISGQENLYKNRARAEQVSRELTTNPKVFAYEDAQGQLYYGAYGGTYIDLEGRQVDRVYGKNKERIYVKKY